MILRFISRYKLSLIGLVLGLIGGYLYYANVGCSTNSCAITSKPLNSTIYGGIMGILFMNLFKKGIN
ncbi:MAG: hypothetical protein ACK5B9_12790 [Flavobacteriia bacterium]|jgi:hypothetical protein